MFDFDRCNPEKQQIVDAVFMFVSGQQPALDSVSVESTSKHRPERYFQLSEPHNLHTHHFELPMGSPILPVDI